VEWTRRLPPAGAAVALLVGISTAVRFYAATRIEGLWIAPDEMIYASLGQSLWEDGAMRIFGGPTGFYSLVYPALAGLPLVLFGLEDGYVVLKAVQALVMSLTAVAVYLWTRRLAGSWWALAAAALTLVVPGLLYAGLIMTEVAFYPALVLAAWATAEALERPTLGRQALLVGAIVLAAATRLQALVLVPVVLGAVALAAWLERDPRLPLRFWPAAAGLALPAVAWVAWRAFASGWSGVLGSYAAAAESEYAPGDSASFVAYHLADVLLLSGFFPVCGVALLAWEALRGRETSPPVRAYVATAVSLTVWLVVEVGVFASENVNHLAERDLLGVAPVLFVGFAVWLARGAPRPRVATAVVALVALGVLLALPLRRFVVEAAIPDAFGVVPLIWLREHTAVATFELVVWLVAALAAVVFVLVPKRLVLALPVVAAAALAFASVAATREVAQRASFDQENYLGGERGWVDRVAGEPVAYLYYGERYWNGVWQQLFWNRRIRQVYAPEGIPPPPGLPLTVVRGEPDGRLLRPDGTPIPERLLVASSRNRLRGEPVAEIQQRFLEEPGLTLWRLDPPARLDTVLTGLRPEGDMHGPAVMRVWDCRAGRLDLTLLPKLSRRVELRVNGRTERVLTLAGEPFVNATLFPPAGARTCTFEVVPDNLLGSTQFAFVRD
jgi:hypothetical protein